MVANTTASRKAKGRKLQQFVAKLIRDTFNLSELDVRSTSMGASGVDIQLSSKATEVFPFAVECKCVEKVNIWEAWTQANAHAYKDNGLRNVSPLVVVKRSNHPPLAIIDLETFMRIVSK